MAPQAHQESVWDYPVIPRVAREHRRVRVYFAGIPVINTRNALRLLVYGRPPGIYVPAQDFKHCELRRLAYQFEEEEIGAATWFTVIAAGAIIHRAVWGFLNPHGPYRRLQTYLGIDASRVDRAFLDEEEVRADASDPTGGWVTEDVVGPFRTDER